MDIFDISTTDILFYDKLLRNGKGLERGNIEVVANIEYMTPDEYFNHCANLNNGTVDEEYDYISENNMQELSNVIKVEKLPIGFLNMVNKTQEGRHRALLAKRLGIELIPVLVVKDSYKYSIL